MKGVYPKTIIFTPEIAGSFENQRALSIARSNLQELNIAASEIINTNVDVFGNLRSVTSFVVPTDNEVILNVVKDLAFKNFKQEVVLYLDGERNAELHYSDGIIDIIGVFKPVDEFKARKSRSGYYYCNTLNSYFIIDNPKLG